MIIVLKQHAPDAQVQAFCAELRGMGFEINDSVGSDTHILGLIGDTKALAESWVLANPVVETCRRVSEPYKKANRKFHPDDTVVDVGGHRIGGGHFAVMAGPCSVEGPEQITGIARRVQAAGAGILRGGAFKPRTSPYSFQGLRAEGLELLQQARAATGQPIVTELMNNEHIPLFEEAGVDMIQIGARNMQNFETAESRGAPEVPVLLKRGLSSTLEELVMSAEYIMAEGNPNVVLCERGIRTFEPRHAQHAGHFRRADAEENDPPAGGDRPQPRGGHRLHVAAAGPGCGGRRGGRADDRGAQRPGPRQKRRRPEPDPRPVRRADGGDPPPNWSSLARR